MVEKTILADQTACRVKSALDAIRNGGLVIVCDDESRENEGDLIAAAQFCSAEMVNFIITEARGLLCQQIDANTVRYLGLPPMVQDNNSMFSTAFTVSLDHREAGTGISAAARALTIRTIGAAAENAQNFYTKEQADEEELGLRQKFREELLRPGHIFPLLARPGGVLQRRGQTEAAMDLVSIAGLQPSGLLCEIVGADGAMAQGEELEQFAHKHQLPKISVEDLVWYRREVLGHTWDEQKSLAARMQDIALEWETSVQLPCTPGNFRCCAIEDLRDIQADHLLIWKGELGSIATGKPPLLRVHSECFTGEVLFSQRCDCRAQLDFSLQAIEAEGRGLVIYLRQEGRGIGLKNKLRAYRMQSDEGLDTVEANQALGFADDLREYSVAVGVLLRLGLRKVRLLTNNPQKIAALEAGGIAVERIAVEVGSNPHNKDYLATKRRKSGHL